MSTAFRFDPVELPPECEALRAEVREFIAGELAAGLWVPNSDFGSHVGGVQPAAGRAWLDRHDLAQALRRRRAQHARTLCRDRGVIGGRRSGGRALDRRPAECAALAALR